MDKKDLENLSVSELLKLKESINDEMKKSALNRRFLVLTGKDYL